MEPENPRPKKVRGPASHREGCGCFACKSTRKRAAQAQLGATGAAPTPTEAPVAPEFGTSMAPEATRMPQEALSGPRPTPTIRYTKRLALGAQEPLQPNLPSFVGEGRSARDRIATWLTMRAEEPGISNAEVARRLGLRPSTINSLISRAVKEGWLRFDDPLDRIEHEIIPATLDNIAEMLAQKSEKVTIETAKGTIFPQFREAKGIQKAPTTVLAIKIEQAPLALNGEVIVTTDQIVGKPLSFHDDKES